MGDVDESDPAASERPTPARFREGDTRSPYKRLTVADDTRNNSMNMRTSVLTLSVTVIAVALMAVPSHAQLFGGGGLLGGGGFRGGGFRGGFGGGRPDPQRRWLRWRPADHRWRCSNHASFASNHPTTHRSASSSTSCHWWRWTKTDSRWPTGNRRHAPGHRALFRAADPLLIAPPEAFFPAAIVLSWVIGPAAAISPRSADCRPSRRRNCPASCVPASPSIGIA